MLILLTLFYSCFVTAANLKVPDIHYITSAPYHQKPDDEFNKYMIECHKKQVLETIKTAIPANIKAPSNDKNIKTAYLTFDDGPSKEITPLILDILQKYNVKATFFVLGGMVQNNGPILSREFNEGHSVGNHTYSHQYNYIYASPERLLGEINKTDDLIKAVFPDYKEKIFRFPGGSFDKSQKFKDSVTNAGYKYVDWNCLNGDAEGINIPAEKLFYRFKNTLQHNNPVIILMHDSSTKSTTVQALPQIIEYLKAQGFEFRTF